jgi:hypothetical protein
MGISKAFFQCTLYHFICFLFLPFVHLVAVWLGDLASVVCGWLWLTMESPQQTQKNQTQDKQGTRQLFFSSAKNVLLKYNGFAARGASKSFGIPPIRIRLYKKIPTSLISRILAMGGSGSVCTKKILTSLSSRIVAMRGSGSVKNNCGSGSKWPKRNITRILVDPDPQKKCWRNLISVDVKSVFNRSRKEYVMTKAVYLIYRHLFCQLCKVVLGPLRFHGI